MKHPVIIILLFSLCLLNACKVDPDPIVTPSAGTMREIVPEGWPQPIYTFEKNPLTEEKFALGRALFFEPMLSADNTISCGSCHQRGSAFAHGDHRVSHGITKDSVPQIGVRNAPGIFNLNWHPYFMHDGGINHIEVQPLGPITNPIEMGEKIPHVVAKLQASARYRELFYKAYGSETVDSYGMFRAMALFMGTMYSYNSRYDFYKRGKAKFTDEEKKGYDLFLAKCNACHTEPLFSDFKFRSNGLKPNPLVNDVGRGMIEPENPASFYKFKTPSLRNLGFTYPYMHDGSIPTLEKCLDHYTNGISSASNPDPLLQGGLQLSADDKTNLLAFLKTLDDYQFISDKRFDDQK